MRVAATGNTEVPAYLAIVSKGYDVECTEGDRWSARNGQHHFIAEGPMELLGLIAMIECRGENWRAEDEEIDEFVRHFCSK